MPKKSPLHPVKYMISAEYWIPEIGENLTCSLIFYAGPSLRKHTELVHKHVQKLDDVCYSSFPNAELKVFNLIKVG